MKYLVYISYYKIKETERSEYIEVYTQVILPSYNLSFKSTVLLMRQMDLMKCIILKFRESQAYKCDKSSLEGLGGSKLYNLLIVLSNSTL